MTNVLLKISTRECIPDNQFLGYEGENEVNKLIFKFEDGFFDGLASLNIHRGELKGYVTLDKIDKTYELEVKNSLLSQKGDVTFQLVITSTEGKVIKFNPFVMTVKDAIDTDVEMPEEYPSWIDEANMKLAEITKAIENAEQVTTEIIEAKENGEFDGEDGFSPSAKVEETEDGALITITDKEGTTTAEIFNGGGGTSNYNTLYNKPKINGVELSGNKSLDTLGIQPKGNYLTGETDPTVPSYVKEITTDDIDSWNNKAEKDDIPQKTSELTNDSNFATTNENNNFSTAQTINGTLTVNGNIVQNGGSYETHAEQVNTKMNEIILREGAVGGMSIGEFAGLVATLYNGIVSGRLGFKADGTAYVGDVGDEQPLLTRDDVANLTEGQVLTWDSEKLRAIGNNDYVKNTDYATSSKGGVVKVEAIYGTRVNSVGWLELIMASNSEINEKTDKYHSIVPANLDYAVKSVVGSHITLTQAEYDALETKDENTFYYIEEE